LVRECFCSGGCRSCAIFRAIFAAGLGPVFDSFFDSIGGSVFGGALGDTVRAVDGTDSSSIIHDSLLIQAFFCLDA
jgi:hypothetical protein